MTAVSRLKAALMSTFVSGTPEQKLGSFLGVFTPSILTILGVILFLRTGWVVGTVGLVPTLVIVGIANVVTLVTALSVSAVVTNMRIGKGGAYYVISRSLGIEVGAAIGVPLYLAMTFSVTLYAFGLAESIAVVWADAPQGPIAAVTILVVALLAARGAGAALRLQLPIMAGIVLALVALLIGSLENAADGVSMLATPPVGADFWAVFAIFFPAVTGIMAGISLSGDLKNPRKAIPKGTIAAVLVGFAVYVTVPIILAAAVPQAELVSNNLIWFDLAGPLSILILWGLWGAIFASAVGSILAAPRTLEAMVDDRILPPALATRSRLIKGPGIPLLISTALALGGVLLGDLDAIAPLLTMFFLTTYGTINLVAGLEALSGDPSYRPTFKLPWWVSIGGAFACFSVMFLINPLALAVALIFEAGLYVFMRRRAMTAPWGDLRRGALMSLVRSTAIKLYRLPKDPRNWRPNILLFAGDVDRRAELVRYAAWLAQERGILTVVKLLVGSIDTLATDRSAEVAALQTGLDELGVVAFPEVNIVTEFESGSVAVAQSNGIAGIESNTVMFGWSDKRERQTSILTVIEQLAALGKSAVVARVVGRHWNGKRGDIHVWWGGLEQNGDLLVLLAHLLSLNPTWRDSNIVINSIATNDATNVQNKQLLDQLCSSARIKATTNTILKPEGMTVRQMICQVSKDAGVVLLGLRGNEPGQEADYAERMGALMEGLPTVLFVRNAGIFRGELLGDTTEEAATEKDWEQDVIPTDSDQ
ncbi:amino acid permease [bacterium BMS3Bbin02]|nr:amino acid permease [bacterium BMS3Bbin02]